MDDVRAIREDSEIAAQFGALEDGRGQSVRFTVWRRAVDGSWLVEITPHLLGVARAEDVRGFARGILDTLAAGAGESDSLPLYDDGYARVDAVVGFDQSEPYVIVDAYFGSRRDGVPHIEAVSASRADLAALANGARALLDALD
ncbi:hypothetical protein OG625_35790 [Streptomyces sp. NBC_01351]|uniref:hypothetical protein n=1 Tax=Streptomyces sp. NBC_01351 TaxID=2903833 RepID=UPI002E356429|nr:hypothetical protein [Streptomyces sp. NBC_01351]